MYNFNCAQKSVNAIEYAEQAVKQLPGYWELLGHNLELPLGR